MVRDALQIGDRAVVGRDLLLLQQWLGLDVGELVFFLGINSLKWTEMTVEKADEPLDDPALALLVWAVLAYPEHSYLPRYPDPQETFSVFQEALRDWDDPANQRGLKTKRAFGLLLGREETSGFRWLSPKTGPKATHPQTRRLMLMLVNLLQAQGGKALNDWLKRVELEADARGVDDLWQNGSWKAEDQNKKQ